MGVKKIKPERIDKKFLNIRFCVECISCGSHIICVTDKDKLIGIVSEGDIERFMKSGQNGLDLAVVNDKFTFVVDDGDFRNVIAKSEEIFKRHPQIYNIPVVDEKGILLYQIDCDESIFIKRIQESFSLIRKCQALSVFLNCQEVKHIILCGGGDWRIKFCKGLFFERIRHKWK